MTLVWERKPRRVLLLSKPVSMAPELLPDLARAAALLAVDHDLEVGRGGSVGGRKRGADGRHAFWRAW